MALPRAPSSAGDAPAVEAPPRGDTILDAVRRKAQGATVEGRGRVTRVLRDDADGSRHQRFLLRLDDGTVVLVAHNIDLAPRVDALREGDTVDFRGEYLWNPKGGVLHWTHHDPRGRHAPGWLRHDGRTYD